MQIKFTKMHGLGNDFVVIDAINQAIALSPEQVRFIANRHFGVGCDQLLLVESPDAPSMDFRYRIFNQDGNEVEQCGNGARCFARFVVDKGLTDKTCIDVQTNTGNISLSLQDNGQVSVNMGVPRFEPEQLPFTAQQRQIRYALPLEADNETLEVGAVSMGNPHAVLLVGDINSAPVARWGPLIEGHPLFPQRVNAGFMQRIDNNHIKLRVYERGVGETLACGTGACAAAVIGQQWGLLQSPVRVELPGGQLIINWPGENQPVTMTGPAVSVFEGQITL